MRPRWQLVGALLALWAIPYDALRERRVLHQCAHTETVGPPTVTVSDRVSLSCWRRLCFVQHTSCTSESVLLSKKK
uniref:Putative secreted protein n=1 Tax=Ixodes ricinus TaxID=34613 RepID=A0A6B0U2P1_IXORI